MTQGIEKKISIDNDSKDDSSDSDSGSDVSSDNGDCSDSDSKHIAELDANFKEELDMLMSIIARDQEVEKEILREKGASTASSPRTGDDQGEPQQQQDMAVEGLSSQGDDTRDEDDFLAAVKKAQRGAATPSLFSHHEENTCETVDTDTLKNSFTHVKSLFPIAEDEAVDSTPPMGPKTQIPIQHPGAIRNVLFYPENDYDMDLQSSRYTFYCGAPGG